MSWDRDIDWMYDSDLSLKELNKKMPRAKSGSVLNKNSQYLNNNKILPLCIRKLICFIFKHKTKFDKGNKPLFCSRCYEIFYKYEA